MFLFLSFSPMLLFPDFLLLQHLGLSQAPFRFARRYVRDGERVAKLHNQLWFVSMCLRLRILPPTVRNLRLPACVDEASKRGIQTLVLKKMKRGLRGRLEKAKEETRELSLELSSLYAMDLEKLRRCRTQAFERTYRRESEHLRNKLASLSGRPESQRPLGTAPIHAGACRVTDKTDSLSDVEKALLGRGPKFALAAAVNPATKEICQTAFARFAYQYRWSVARGDDRSSCRGEDGTMALPVFPRSSDVHVPPTNTAIDAKLRRIYHAVAAVVDRLPERRRWSNLPQEESIALEALRRKPIALMPSDKGGEFCAIEVDAYNELGRCHLADTATYKRVPRMTAKTVEGKINKEWKAVCNERGVPVRSERSFVASNTRLATFHHLLKTHKPGPQLKIRPIVASRGSPTERISWLLSRILGPLLGSVPSHIPNSDSLMTAVTSTTPQVLSQHRYQCSLDVVALYTSIPVGDALAAVLDKLLQGARVIPSPLQVEDVIRLLRAVFGLTYFHHEDRVYQQISGLPMGSAVSGIVAILFMEKIEERALSQFARCPLFRRYVDDCYALVGDAEDARELHDTFNRQHPAIAFDLENCRLEGDATSLSLLDLTVRINPSGEASFVFFTKDAKSDIFVHKESAHSWSQKTAAIRNEARRIEARSGGDDRERNIAAFERKLQHNGYSQEDIRRAQPPSRRRPPRTRLGGTPYYIDLPYLGESAEHKIRRAFTREGINIRVYRRSTTILDIVRPRKPDMRRCTWEACPTKQEDKCFVRNCVYEITCTPCGRRYVGSTTRPLHERIREHTSSGRGSTVHGHLVTCGGGTARVRVRIVTKEKDEVNTRLREAIVIRKTQPELNTREESDLVDLVF